MKLKTMKLKTMNLKTINPHRKISMNTLVILGLLSIGSLAQAGTGTFDKQMQPVLEEYLKIPKALAADQTTDVVAAAKKIKQLAAKLNSSSVTGEHAKHFKNIPSDLRAGAEKMIKAKNIKDMREALKDLSKPMAMWVTMSKPKGVSVMYCSMAPGSWLQRGTTVANPYYGAKMLRCGDIVAGVGVKQNDMEHHEHHGGGGHNMHSGHHMGGKQGQ